MGSILWSCAPVSFFLTVQPGCLCTVYKLYSSCVLSHNFSCTDYLLSASTTSSWANFQKTLMLSPLDGRSECLPTEVLHTRRSRWISKNIMDLTITPKSLYWRYTHLSWGSSFLWGVSSSATILDRSQGFLGWLSFNNDLDRRFVLSTHLLFSPGRAKSIQKQSLSILVFPKQNGFEKLHRIEANLENLIEREWWSGLSLQQRALWSDCCSTLSGHAHGGPHRRPSGRQNW